MACAPVFAAISASSTSRMPFRISLPGQMLADPVDVLPGQRGVELRGDPFRERVMSVGALDVADQIAEGPPLAAQHAGRPRPAWWRNRPVSTATIPAAPYMPFLMSAWRCPITCRSTVRTSALHLAAIARSTSALDEAAVLHDVELEPERLVDGARDILDRADRHRARRERNACGLRGAAGVNFAVAMLHAQ